MYLDAFAEVFAAAGLAALVYDNRNFGASDGEPRQEIVPADQIEDYRHAISYARTLPGIDRDRIGIWGSSYSGSHVLVVGAIDRRVKCVVAQVPLVTGLGNASRLVRSDFMAGLRETCDTDREARFEGKEPGMIPVVSENPLGACVLPTQEAWQWFSETSRTRAPSWRNEVTIRSVDTFLGYEPGVHIGHIGPTPFRMVVAAEDTITPVDLSLDYYREAREPKSIVVLPGGHFGAYTGPSFELASAAARDWFVQHLHP
jgi:fermentation-respiration switch protein FrsA (DUF1100 family)